MHVPNFPPPDNLEHFPCGGNFAGDLHPIMFDTLFIVLFSIDEYNFGRLSRIWAVTPFDASTWRRNYDPTKLEFKAATLSDVLPTTLENLKGRTPSMPLTEL